MKKTTLLLLVLVLTIATGATKCNFKFPTIPSPFNIPNPGFALVTTRRTSFRERVLPGAVTGSRLIARADNANGSETRFRLVSNNSGRADAINGVAPGFWGFSCDANWDACTGLVFSGEIERGVLNYGICADVPISAPRAVSTLSPNSIDGTASPLEFTAYAEGLNTTYGMPTFQFINEYGTVAAQTTATSVSPENIWVKGWSSCLSGLPTGPYFVKVINATADGVGAEISTSDLYIYGGFIQRPIDDPSFFVHMQYLDVLGYEPDTAGWQYWTGQITQCGSDAGCIASRRTAVAYAIYLAAPFYQTDPDMAAGQGSPGYNAAFVRHCYLSYLGREPESDFWVNVLNSSGNYNGVIEAFITSEEYKARFDPPPPTPDPICNPTSYEVRDCEMQGGSWDYGLCRCSLY